MFTLQVDKTDDEAVQLQLTQMLLEQEWNEEEARIV